MKRLGSVVISPVAASGSGQELANYLAWGHQGFWNTFAFHVPSLDLTVAGSILNHHPVEKGQELAKRLVFITGGAA